MKAYDIIGWAILGDTYCTDCGYEEFGLMSDATESVDQTSDHHYPIFADQEWDGYPVCGRCFRVIQTRLTEVGYHNERWD